MGNETPSATGSADWRQADGEDAGAIAAATYATHGVIMPGLRVSAKFGEAQWGAKRTKFYMGVIRTVNDDGTYVVDFDDGDTDERVKLQFIKPQVDAPGLLPPSESGNASPPSLTAATAPSNPPLPTTSECGECEACVQNRMRSGISRRKRKMCHLALGVAVVATNGRAVESATSQPSNVHSVLAAVPDAEMDNSEIESLVPAFAGAEGEEVVEAVETADEAFTRMLMATRWVVENMRSANGDADKRKHWRLEVTRGHEMESLLAKTKTQPIQQRRNILTRTMVTFTSAGAKEEGEDAGGLSAELFTNFFEQAFAPDAGLFECEEAGQLLPKPAPPDASSEARAEHYERLRGVGKVILKCLVDEYAIGQQLSVFNYAFFLAEHRCVPRQSLASIGSDFKHSRARTRPALAVLPPHIHLAVALQAVRPAWRCSCQHRGRACKPCRVRSTAQPDVSSATRQNLFDCSPPIRTLHLPADLSSVLVHAVTAIFSAGTPPTLAS